MIDLRRMYRILQNWFNKTFGKDRDPFAIVTKLQEEMNELNMAVQEYEQWSTYENRKKVQEEISDMTILLINLSTNYGLCYDAFVDNIIAKHRVNKNRKWVEMPDGTFKHLPDDLNITEK